MSLTKIPRISLASCKISADVLKMVQPELLQKYSFMPFDFEKEKLSIAIDDPSDLNRIDNIRVVTGYELELFQATRDEISDCIRRHLFRPGKGPWVPEFESLCRSFLGTDLQGGESFSVVKITDRLFELAVERHASDIHLEPQQDSLFVRFRIDGILTTVHAFPKPAQTPLLSRIKVLSGMDITEKRLPQDGQFELEILKRTIDMRVSTLPGKYGEKCVIRVLDKSSFAMDFGLLGFDPSMQSRFETLIQKPQGILLVTGPTGSGKTTTLYSVLNRLKSPLKNVITLEDPIEYELLAGKANESGITQVQINHKIGMSFAAGLRASLRQDPDIIMVGEIRDKDTAEIAMKAALTGHLVLSTLHTNDALGTLFRLRDMGIENYLIHSTLNGVLAQRLVRLLCPHCKTAYRPPAKAIRNLFPKAAPAELSLYRSKGCDRCGDSGYSGRKGIFELLTMTDDLKQLLNAGTSIMSLQQSESEAVRQALPLTLRESGLELVRQGLTTIEEIFRITME